MDDLHVLVAIPAWNEAAHLGALLASVSEIMAGRDLLVVDDGSTDQTREIACSYPVQLLVHERNRGKGACLKTAFRWARQQRYNWILFLDGDGQHESRFIPDFVDAMGSDRFDVIIGNRQARGRCMPWHRRVSNRLSSLLVSLWTSPVRIHDSQCGFRAVRLSHCDPEWFREDGFQFETEFILTLARRGCRFGEVPISTRYHSTVSRIAIISDTIRFFRVILRHLCKRPV